MASAVGAHLLLAPLAAAGALLAGAAPASAETLSGSIQGGRIALRHADGTAVSRLPPGPYTFEVTDREVIHNFHVVGTSVRTPIDEATGVFTFPDVVLAAGQYVYRCDVHPEVNGAFGVAQPPPPSTPPATIVRVRTTRAGGVRSVVVTLAVTRRTSATAHLRRAGRTVAGTRKAVEPGRRRLVLRVPRRARGGLYALRLTLREAGRVFVRTRTVRVPAPRRTS